MFSAIKLRTIRLREQKKLNKSNLCLYKNMIAYIQISNSTLTMGEKEEVLHQIMDILLQAQFEGKSVDIFIGKDYEIFCNSIIDEYNNSKYYKVFKYVQMYLLYTMLVIVLTGIFNAVGTHSFDHNITIDQLIDINALTLFIIPIIRIRKQGTISVFNMNFNINYKSKCLMFIASFVAIDILRILIKSSLGAEVVMNYNISLFNNIYLVLSMIIFIGMIEVYKRRYDKYSK